MPDLNAIDGETYSGLPFARLVPFVVRTAHGVLVSYDPRAETRAPVPEEILGLAPPPHVVQARGQAINAFRAAHGGRFPQSVGGDETPQ